MTEKDFGIKIEQTELSNGIPLTLFQKKGMPIFVRVVFASGSRYEDKSNEGLSHFAEHMVVAGSKDFPTKDKMATYLENLGGQFGASTDLEFLTLKVEVADKEDFSEGVYILDQMLSESLFDDDIVEKERGSILEEIGEYESNPSRFVPFVYYTNFFQGTDYESTILGSKESVKSISQQDLKNFYKEMFNAGRAVILVAGDIDLEQTKKELDEGLPLEKSERIKFKGKVALNRNQPITIKKYKGQEQVQFMFGFPTVPVHHDDNAALDIINAVYGGGRASVLSRRLRYENGLVYSVNSRQTPFIDAGCWFVKSSTSKDNFQETMDIILEEVENIHSGKISEKELKFGKNKIIKSAKRKFQTSESWTSAHSYLSLAGDKRKLPELLDLIDKVTIDDLQRVGRSYFKPDTWYLSLCGDIGEEEFNINY